MADDSSVVGDSAIGNWGKPLSAASLPYEKSVTKLR